MITFPSLPLPGRPLFGARPPRLGTPLNEDELARYAEREPWVDPDGGWVRRGKRVDVPRDEVVRIMDASPRNAMYLMPMISLGELCRSIGPAGVVRVVKELGGLRTVKELVKNGLSDPYQDYWPKRVNGHWAHEHDAQHVEVSTLEPIRMGKARRVNGIDGHSYHVVPLFHPDNPQYRARYNGMLDEYRVAIHVACKSPSPMNLMRLFYYIARFKKIVPDPWTVIEAHKKTMETGGIPVNLRKIGPAAGKAAEESAAGDLASAQRLESLPE